MVGFALFVLRDWMRRHSLERHWQSGRAMRLSETALEIGAERGHGGYRDGLLASVDMCVLRLYVPLPSCIASMRSPTVLDETSVDCQHVAAEGQERGLVWGRLFNRANEKRFD